MGQRPRRKISSGCVSASPESVSGLPSSSCNATSLQPVGSGLPQDKKQRDKREHSQREAGDGLSSTVTPSSNSPHGSATSATADRGGYTPSIHGAAAAAAAAPLGVNRQAFGASRNRMQVTSRDGSRGSSPWHLPSPASDMGGSYMTPSQPSCSAGSDSPGGCPIEYHYASDLSQCDTPGGSMGPSGYPHQQQSDSDTPRSDVVVQSRGEQQPPASRYTPLSRRLERTLNSPGGPAPPLNFREALGINSGPVMGAPELKARSELQAELSAKRKRQQGRDDSA